MASARNTVETATRLFEENIALAIHIASKHRTIARRAGLEFDDLLQEAYRGLWHACLRFDATRGLRFSSYAHTCIRGLLLVGVNRYRFGTAYENVGFDQSKRLVSTTGNGDVAELIDRWSTTDRSIVADEIERRERAEIVRDVIAELPEPQSVVVRLRMIEGTRLRPPAQALGVSRERVRQIQAAATDRIRRSLVRRGVETA